MTTGAKVLILATVAFPLFRRFCNWSLARTHQRQSKVLVLISGLLCGLEFGAAFIFRCRWNMEKRLDKRSYKPMARPPRPSIEYIGPLVALLTCWETGPWKSAIPQNGVRTIAEPGSVLRNFARVFGTIIGIGRHGK